MRIGKQQLHAIGDLLYAGRMRQYLNKQFPESAQMDARELEQIILRLTHRAANYKLILEIHVAPFIVASWIMGIGFDQNFLAAKEVLEDLDMDSEKKSEWLWQFLDETITMLEGEPSVRDMGFLDNSLKG